MMTPLHSDSIDQTDIVSWLQSQAKTYTYMLAFALDGVIWGRVDSGTLITSADATANTPFEQYCPALQNHTLQEARLFSASAELHIWFDGALWQGCTKQAQSADDTLPDHQMVWGDTIESVNHRFTFVSDGAQGLRHAIPIEITDKTKLDKRPIRLCLAHHLATNEDGFVTIAHSRLTGVIDSRAEKCHE